MISREDFNTRTTALYSYMRSRFGPRNFTAGKRRGQRKTDGVKLPFSVDELQLWLLRKVGMQAIQCRYCSAPIDILSLVLDHMTPIDRGGQLGLDNLDPICARCNTLKSDLTVAEYTLVVIFLQHPDMAYARTSIESRLFAGEMGKKLARTFRADKAKKAAGYAGKAKAVDAEPF